VKIATPSWRKIGTPDWPVRIRMPDGSWRLYGGGFGVPLKQKQPDGSWRVVSTEGPGGLWYVAADAGAAGTVVDPIPARFGPSLIYRPDSFLGVPTPRCILSADAIPALEFTGVGNPTHYHEDIFVVDPDTEYVYNGLAHGFTVFIVAAIPPSSGPDVGMFRPDAFVDGVFSYDPFVNVTLNHAQLTVLIDGAGADFKAIQVTPTFSGAAQLIEVRYQAEDDSWSVRIGGVELPRTLDELTGLHLSDFVMRGVRLLGVGTHGTSAKLWETKVYLTGLTDAALTAARQYFATKYGIAT
jgi:hypothetical protein